MSERTARAAVGLAAVAVALTATAVTRAAGEERPRTAPDPERLSVTSTVEGGTGTVHPGGGIAGSISITNAGEAPRRITDVGFAPAVSDACARTGLSLAPTVAPTPEAPLEVPAGGTAVLAWTGYMDGDGEHGCQGSRLRSDVTLDGEAAGAVILTAGELAQPPAPTGGLTTSSRAAVRWSASTAAAPGWVLERAVAGTDDWQPACGSSASRPLRVLACTDTGLAEATSYTYRVTLRTGHWHMTSRPSAPVTTQLRPST